MLCCKEEGGLKNFVRKILKKHIVESDLEERKFFEGCRHLYDLPFDFYITSLKLAVVLEYEHLSYSVPEWADRMPWITGGATTSADWISVKKIPSILLLLDSQGDMTLKEIFVKS